MPAMTYNSLMADLQAYLERGDVSDPTVFAQLPSLVNLAERDIATKLKVLGLLIPLANTMTAGQPTLPKPDRWRATVSLNYTSATPARVPIYPRAYEYCRRYWPNELLTGPPRFYADYDFGNWLIVPTPDLSYDFEANVWQLPVPLSALVQTNWLTDYAPNALLDGSLLQCAPFLKDDGRIPTWKSKYDEDLQALDGQDLQRILDRTSARTEV